MMNQNNNQFYSPFGGYGYQQAPAGMMYGQAKTPKYTNPLSQEKIQKLCHQDTAKSVKYECDKSHSHDKERIGPYKALCLKLCGDGDAQKKGNQVGESGLCRFRKCVQYTAFLNQVAEH